MARETYAQRNARAQAQGYTGYWQQRQARKLGLVEPVRGRPDRPKGGLSLKSMQRMPPSAMRAGVAALKRKDFKEADRIAAKYGVRKLSRRPRGMSDAEWQNARANRRIFYYH